MDWAAKIYIGPLAANRRKGDIVGTDDDRVETWTTGQAAAYLKDLGVSRRKVRQLVDAGKLDAVQTEPGEWARIYIESVKAYRRARLAGRRTTDRDAASTDT